MPEPAVSILLPFYNSEKFLRKAIDSLLSQTFRNFELLAINDGSTDDTEKVILSYADNRIVYIKNKGNKGLAYTLNRGIKLAKGKYIARMDADDISLTRRLQKQFDWLEKFPSTDIVGCHVSFINEHGKPTGEWKDELSASTFQKIKEKMIWESCIAHPSVMMRSEVIKQYLYHENQKNTEDYDLWLRLLADGFIIEKIPEKLLLYRVHEASVTGSILRKSNPFFKLFHCKRRFLWYRISEGSWGIFETKIVFTTIHNCIMGIGKEVKGMVKG